MEGFYMRPTRVTPSVYFKPDVGILDMRGKSSPENPLKFFEFLNSNLRRFEKARFKDLSVNMAFDYFNTSSSKCIFNMFRILDGMHHNGVNIKVNWYYERDDEDMFESGEDLSFFFDFRFNFVMIDEIKILGDCVEDQEKVAY